MTIRESWDALMATPLEAVFEAVVLFGVGFLAVCAVLFIGFLLWSWD